MVSRWVLLAAAGCGRIGFDPRSIELDPAAQVHRVAAGTRFSCAIRGDETVWCWGDNSDGQLGVASGAPSPSPVQIAGIDRAVAIGAGADFACALRDDGSVWCWGGNSVGELGNADAFDHPTPAQVALPGIATQLSVGILYTCARLDTGAAWCWGRNYEGEIANVLSGDPIPPTEQPLDDVVEIVAGNVHTVALRGDGSVWTWGYPENGELGRDGDGVAPIDGLVATSVGAFDASCAVTTDGHYRCWGPDGDGELGDGARGDPAAVPDPPSQLGGVVAVTVGDHHACALLADQTVACWGDNDLGELGAGDRTGRTLPVVLPLAGVVSISAGGDHTCAILADDSVACWGRGTNGQLGDGTIGAFQPHTVSLPAAATAITAGDLHTCAIAGGTAYCWGEGGDGELGDGLAVSHATPTAVPLANVTGIAAGSIHTCAFLGDGTAWCWGDNQDGELGDGGVEITSATPVQVAGPGTTIAIAAGNDSACQIVIATTPLVACWGRGDGGEIGNGEFAHEATPTATLPIVAGVASIAAGAYNVCAIAAGGALSCWGLNDNGELGTGDIMDRDSPTPTIATNVAAVATRGEHTCALLMSGGVQCWGIGGDGELGDGNYATWITPHDVTQLSPVGPAVIAAGDTTTCVSAAGLPGVQCWGSNTFGQLGDPLLAGSGVPDPVVGVPGITALAMGSAQTCAIDQTGVVWCWGDNAHGEQGTGTFSRALAPVMVAFP